MLSADLAVSSPWHYGVWDCYESPSGASAGQFLLDCLFKALFIDSIAMRWWVEEEFVGLLAKVRLLRPRCAEIHRDR
jgi:hypothetical protein